MIRTPDEIQQLLAIFAPEPWSLVLAEHREVLRTLAFEIRALTADNARLLQAGEHAIRETLDRHLGPCTGTGYDPAGTATASLGGATFLDQHA